MKRSRLSFDTWRCITSKKLKGKRVNADFFSGYINVMNIEEVSEKQIWRFNGENIVVCDNGLKWVSILPENDYYCITAMLDENDAIILWYIDMLAEQGVDPDGIPYFYDLYLDLIVYPDGTIKVDDMNELEEALSVKDITQEQFELAIDTADRLKAGLLNDMDAFIEYTMKCNDMVC